MGQSGLGPAAASCHTPRGQLRLRFVAEARKKLAGGGAQRNHRIDRPEARCAPAGRESRGTRRRASPWRRCLIGGPPGLLATPWACAGRGPSRGGCVVEVRGVGALSRRSRPAGAHGWVGVVGPVVPLRFTTG